MAVMAALVLSRCYTSTKALVSTFMDTILVIHIEPSNLSASVRLENFSGDSRGR